MMASSTSRPCQYTEITVAVVMARCVVGIPAPVVLFTQGVRSPSWVKSIFGYVVKMSALMFCGMFLKHRFRGIHLFFTETMQDQEAVRELRP